MCGIIGVVRFGEEPVESIRESSAFFGSTLTELTETRGKDATGVVTLFDDGNFFGQKMGVSASKFVSRFGGKDDDFEGLLEVMRNYDIPQRMFVGHCRKKSVGNAVDNVNNHPIKTESIIGVHNGTLKNHNVIFENLKCKRDGTVDSEAIFRLMAYYTKNCKEPFTTDNLVEVFKRLEGSFSILAFNANNPYQLVSAKDGRPVEYCMIKPLKTVLIASEKGFIDTALWEYNKLSSLYKIPGFITLRASDVEYATIKEDQLALFDLTREITEETKIEELYDVEDIPKAHQRLWKAPVTNTYNQHYNNTNNNWGRNNTEQKPNNTTPPANKGVNNNDTKTAEAKVVGSSKKNIVGRVWNEALEKYVKAFSGTEERSSVIIGVEGTAKYPLSVREAFDYIRKDSESPSEDKDFKSISDIKKEARKTKQFELSKALHQIENFSEDEKTDSIISRKITEPVEDNTKEPEKEISVDKESSYTIEGNRIAKEHIEEIEKFENSAEVASVCNTDASSIAQLPVHALANRLNRLFFTKYFVRGFVAAKKLNEKDAEKNVNQKYIRVLKALTKNLTTTLDSCVDDDTRKSAYDHFKSLIKGNSELNKGSFRSVFNSGDIRDSSTLAEIDKALKE